MFANGATLQDYGTIGASWMWEAGDECHDRFYWLIFTANEVTRR